MTTDEKIELWFRRMMLYGGWILVTVGIADTWRGWAISVGLLFWFLFVLEAIYTAVLGGPEKKG